MKTKYLSMITVSMIAIAIIIAACSDHRNPISSAGKSTNANQPPSAQKPGGTPPPAAGTVIPMLTSTSTATVQGALFENINPVGSTGTGVIQPFVQLSPGGGQTYEQGVNTSGKPRPFDEGSSANFNRDLPLNLVPQVRCNDTDDSVCREIVVDINEVNSNPDYYLSLDRFILFVHKQPGFSKNDINTSTFPDEGSNGPCDDTYFDNSTCQVVYDLDGQYGPHPAPQNDVALMLNYTLNSGSGDGDVRIRVPDFGPATCGYNGGFGPDCGYYLSLYSEYGATPDDAAGTYSGGGTASDGFEENTVRKLPVLTVKKTVKTSAEAAYEWNLTKTVKPSDWKLFKGESATSDYTITVTKTSSYTNWQASGEIVITNVSDKDAPIIAVQDEGVTLDCPGGFPYVLPAGGTYTCGWSGADLVLDEPYTNTARVVLDDPDFTGTTPNQVFTGSSDEITITKDSVPDEVRPGSSNDTATLDDSYEGTGSPQDVTLSDGATFNYSRTFTCGDANTYTNTATLTDKNGPQTATAEVTVSCYEIGVSKTASTSYNRYYTWEIDKKADKTELTLQPNETFDINYTVDVGVAGSTDKDWDVNGEITISNPHPSRPAVLTAAVDSIDLFGDVAVNCGGVTQVPSGGSITCTYDTGNQSGANPFGGTNKATATRQNYDFASDGTPTADGTTNVSGTAAVTFKDPTEVYDECVDVSDTYAGALGTVCAPAAQSFTYTRTVGPYGAICGTVPVDNTASFITNDNHYTGEDSWSVLIHVPCPSCTLTQGYWKTHNTSFWGGAPSDPTWGLVGGPNATFFDSDNGNVNPNLPAGTPDGSYIDAMWTAPAGNMYFQLARQYIAAKLNSLAFGSLGSYQAVFDQATTFLSTHSQEQVGADDTLNAQAQSLASQLATYNESGDGSGACSLDTFSIQYAQ